MIFSGNVNCLYKFIMAWYKCIGIIGWSITIPTLVGLALGDLIESFFLNYLELKPFFVTCGFVTGFFYAWYWCTEECRKKNEY